MSKLSGMTRAVLDPLAVTLAIDDDARQRFDDERATLWPDAPAPATHVQLFREVPGEIAPAVRLDLADAAGAPIASIASLVLRPLEAAGQTEEGSLPADSLFRVDWQLVSPTPADATEQSWESLRAAAPDAERFVLAVDGEPVGWTAPHGGALDWWGGPVLAG